MRLGFIALNALDGVETDARFAREHGFDGLEFNFWHHPQRSGFRHPGLHALQHVYYSAQ